MASERLQAQIEAWFTYHRPTPGQALRYKHIREQYHKLATLLAEVCPESAELTLALRDLQRSCMMANASIACNEDVYSEDVYSEDVSEPKT